MAWTGVSDATRPGWRQLSAVTNTNNDWDFELRLSEQYPMYVLDDSDPRVLKLWDSAFTVGV